MANVKREIFDSIDRFCSNRSLYNALYVNLYKIGEKYKTSVYKNELESMFLSLVKEGHAKTFFIQNDGFLVIYNKLKKDDVSSLLIKIEFLFQEDELVKSNSDLQKSGIVVFYDVGSEYPSLCKKIEASYDEKVKMNSVFVEQNSYKKSAFDNKRVFTTEMLSKVQKVISVSDFSSFIRRQAICAIIGKSAPQRVFEKVFVDVDDIRDSLMPGVNIRSNPWLNLALMDTLNKRVLDIISRHDDGDLLGNFSININVSSILSDEFIQFDDSINGSMRSTVILELKLEDIFSDMNSYMLARTFAKARGYKICIDGITVDKLNYINRSKLNCDLMKIEWSPLLIDIFNKDEHFMDYKNKAERAKIILYNIDNSEAIEAGNNLGINMYQGRYVQKMLSDNKSA